MITLHPNSKRCAKCNFRVRGSHENHENGTHHKKGRIPSRVRKENARLKRTPHRLPIKVKKD
jgi:hypothetical protein